MEIVITAAYNAPTYPPLQRLNGLNESIFPDQSHPFYSIPWFLALTRDDINRLERRSGVEAYLSDRVVHFYLTYVAAKAEVRTVVVSPQFTVFNHRPGDSTNAFLTTTGARQNFQLALIPVQRAMHWTVAIYDTRMPTGPVVYYFDPLQRPLTEEVRNVINAAVWTIHPDGHRLLADIRIAANPDEKITFNLQNDGVNCGVHVCLIAHLYVLYNRQTFEQDLDIWSFRGHVCDVCKIIRGGILLHYGAINDSE